MHLVCSAVSKETVVCTPAIGSDFSHVLIRNLIPDYSFSHVLKVTGRVLRCVSLVRERKEMGGNYRGLQWQKEAEK